MSYSTSGDRILHNGSEIQLFGLNWYGFEQPSLNGPDGLHTRRLGELIDDVKRMGFNAIRIPFAPRTLENVEVPEGMMGIWGPDNGINLELKGIRSLDLLDYFLIELENRGIRYILDHHFNPTDISELWYADNYSEQQWLDSIRTVASRYKGRPGFVGIDLKNEPRGRARWGSGDQSVDWNSACERAFHVIDSVNSDILVFVEGVEIFDPTSATGWTGWGTGVQNQLKTPLNIPLHRTVFSPHIYGPDVWASQSYFYEHNFPENMPERWERDFGVLAPKHCVVIGEFGGRCRDRDKTWHEALVSWMLTKNMTSFFYWTLNPPSGDTAGVLLDDWKTPDQNKLAVLNRLRTDKATFFGEQTSAPVTSAPGLTPVVSTPRPEPEVSEPEPVHTPEPPHTPAPAYTPEPSHTPAPVTVNPSDYGRDRIEPGQFVRFLGAPQHRMVAIAVTDGKDSHKWKNKDKPSARIVTCAYENSVTGAIETVDLPEKVLKRD